MQWVQSKQKYVEIADPPGRLERQWAELCKQFHQTKELVSNDIVFAEACYCGGSMHKWGSLSNATCPARSKKAQMARMEALGQLLDEP